MAKRRAYELAGNRGANVAPPPPAALRTTPVRVTLDLRPAFHARFKKWCNLTAVQQDLPEVAMAPVLRILVDELMQDQELAARVAERLKTDHAEAQRTGVRP